jgi:hypothetical protein
MIYKNTTSVYVNSVNVYPNYGTVNYTGIAVILNEQEKLDYISQIEKLLTQPKNLNFGKTIYTGTLSNIPRFKLKEYITENKLKRTSRQEYCDSIIIDKTLLTNTLKFLKNMDKKDIIRNHDHENFNLLRRLFEKYYSRTDWGLSYPERTFSIINTRDGASEILNTSSSSDIIEYVKNADIEHLYHESLYREKNIENVILLLDFLKSNPNINIIFDEFLLEELNEDGLDIDDEYLNTLEGMLSSGQNDNVKLAIEMMSNIKLDETNALTIALLLNKYQNIFDHGSGITPSSMNSFKVIDRYYKSRGIIWKSEWRHFAKGLYKNYRDHSENKQIIETFILKNLNELLKSNKFQIKSFDLAFLD